MGIDRLCKVLAQPLRRPCIYLSGVHSRLPNDLAFAPALLHMAPIISMVHGVSKHFVGSCCTLTTDLVSANNLSDISDTPRASPLSRAGRNRRADRKLR